MAQSIRFDGHQPHKVAASHSINVARYNALRRSLTPGGRTRARESRQELRRGEEHHDLVDDATITPSFLVSPVRLCV